MDATNLLTKLRVYARTAYYALTNIPNDYRLATFHRPIWRSMPIYLRERRWTWEIAYEDAVDDFTPPAKPPSQTVTAVGIQSETKVQ